MASRLELEGQIYIQCAINSLANENLSREAATLATTLARQTVCYGVALELTPKGSTIGVADPRGKLISVLDAFAAGATRLSQLPREAFGE